MSVLSRAALFALGGVVFNANDLLTAIIVPVAFILLALFLQRSSEIGRAHV